MKLAPVDYGDTIQPATGNWLEVLSGLAKPFIEGEVQRRYGGGSGLADRASVNANGELRPAGQPATPEGFLSGVTGLLQNPLTWVVVGAALGVGVFLARR